MVVFAPGQQDGKLNLDKSYRPGAGLKAHKLPFNLKMNLLKNPFVSVIVPVFNDAKSLETCLQALEKQTYPQNLYEIIVIDNASDEEQDIKGVVAKFNQAIAIYEHTPSSYAARNQGIFLAKGEIIAFTDADCIPFSNWIKKGVENLLQVPHCGLVVGKIEVFFKNSNCLSMAEFYESIMAFPQKKYVEEEHFGATANVFTFKEVIELVGVFDARLKSGGDREWGNRIYTYGYRQIYAEDTCVSHPARHSFKALSKKAIRRAGGFYDLDLRRRQNYSYLKKKIFFINSLWSVFTRHSFFNAFVNPKLKTLNQKIKLFLVMCWLISVEICEMCRLELGGISTRE